MYNQTTNEFLQNYSGYVAGSISGIAQVIIGQPFDIVKVRLQASKSPNESMARIIKNLIQAEGPGGFYKGTMAPLIGISGITSIQFGVYELMKNRIAEQKQTSLSNLMLPDLAMSGSIACIAASVLTIPVEHIRIRMQIQSAGNIKYVSTGGCFKFILQEYGLKGLYRGGFPGVLRESIMGLQYAFYETYKKIAQNQYAVDAQVAQLISGGLAGLSVWAIMFPLDSVKSIMQADSLRNPKIRGTLHCIKKIGFSNLYKGLTPCLVRSIPVNMGSFFVYEKVKQLIMQVTSKPLEN